MNYADKKICLLYTGGTIGMTRSENGYVPERDAFLHMLRGISDLNRPDSPKFDVIEFDPLLDSCNIAVCEWNQMGQAIADHYAEYDGFVILHGTDTMSYSASALSFMLENLAKPVIFTGAQIPLCEIRSDARGNIVNAVLIAAAGIVNEVCIYFDGRLLRGNRSTKKSSDQFAAFESPNYPLLAEAGIQIRYLPANIRPRPEAPFRFQPFAEVPIGVIKLFPGIQFELFEHIMTESLKGVILESFGAGNIPSSRTSILPIIEKAHRNGSIIVVCSQCVQGTVTLGTYATSKALHDIGAVDGHDMNTEAALAKLYFLLSKGYPMEVVRQLMTRNLCGELTAN